MPSRSRRERFKKVVFMVLAAHVVLLLCLLMTDYHHDLVIYARELPNGATPPAIDPPDAVAEQTATAAASRPHTVAIASVTAVTKPAPTLTKAATTTVPARPETYYTVQSGDTLDSIAKKYGTTVRAIRVANSLPSEHLRVSQKLKIL